MVFVVTCLSDISDFISNWYILCFNCYDLIKGHVEVKGHQVQLQNHHLSVIITNLCLLYLG